MLAKYPIVSRFGVAYETEKMINYPGVGEGALGLTLDSGISHLME